mgnify:CR=1 FL=1
MNILELFEDESELTLKDALRDFLPLVVDYLELKSLPEIKLERSIDDTKYPTFGRYINGDKIIQLDISNRHPVDILRTLAHELVHYKQDLFQELDADSGVTGSSFENEANAQAGIIMREFNTKFPQYLKLTPIILP